jgi:hypothetical protein
MVNLMIKDDLASRLGVIAEREQRTLEDVLDDVVRHYEARMPADEATDEQMAALDELIGFIKADVPDLSMSVRETMKAYYERKYDRVD